MPKFSVQENHPGCKPVFVYSIIDDDINALAQAIDDHFDRFVARIDGQSSSISPADTEKWLRRGAIVSSSRWNGSNRIEITFRNTMRLAVEASSREEADKAVMIDYEMENEEGEDILVESSEQGSRDGDDEQKASERRLSQTPSPAEQIKLEKFRELIVSSGLLNEASMSGGDVLIELEDGYELAFKFMLPMSVKHSDIMSKPCEWAADFGADIGRVEFGRDNCYHVVYSIEEG